MTMKLLIMRATAPVTISMVVVMMVMMKTMMMMKKKKHIYSLRYEMSCFFGVNKNQST